MPKIKTLFNVLKNRAIMNYLKIRYRSTFFREKEINGIKYIVFLNEGIGREIYGFGCYESETTKFLERVIGHDWVCLDVGANIGYYTLLFSKIASEGKIYSFEPNLTNIYILNWNLYLNGIKNVIPSTIALSNQTGQGNFFITSDSGFSSLRDTKRIPISETISVPMITLDDFIEIKAVDRIDLIKIDVEGAEKIVLDGARDSLKRFNPKILLVEICEENLQAFGHSASSIFNFLLNLEYEPYRLSNGSLSHVTASQVGRNENIFFINKDYANDIIAI